MSSLENHELTEKNKASNSEPILRSFIFWILLTIGFITIILGFFSVISVLIVYLQQVPFDYSNGLLLGFLLMLGGFILIIGLLIIRKWTPPPISDTNIDSS